eukprot:6187434-Pleurochrysis_carterae.AAC.1
MVALGVARGEEATSATAGKQAAASAAVGSAADPVDGGRWQVRLPSQGPLTLDRLYRVVQQRSSEISSSKRRVAQFCAVEICIPQTGGREVSTLRLGVRAKEHHVVHVQLGLRHCAARGADVQSAEVSADEVGALEIDVLNETQVPRPYCAAEVDLVEEALFERRVAEVDALHGRAGSDARERDGRVRERGAAEIRRLYLQPQHRRTCELGSHEPCPHQRRAIKRGILKLTL